MAICLNHYIVAQGKSPETALENFSTTLASEVAYGIEHGLSNPLSEIPKAPKKYWDSFDAAREIQDLAPAQIDLAQGDKWKWSGSPPWDKVEYGIAAY